MTPRPTPANAALVATRPFVAPEELARRAGHATLLRLGANESAFGASLAALDAMRDELARAAWYGDPESTALREALAARHGCALENVTVASGIDDLLGLIARAYLAEGDATVTADGTYPTYAYFARGCGARVATLPYRADGTIALDELAALARATNARVAYLANPDNPSGSFAAPAALAAFVEALPAACLLVLDEAYADFVTAEERLPDAIDARIVRLRTFSKAYGLAGMRIGYAIGDARLGEALGKIRVQYGVNRIAQAGALAALGDGAFVAAVVAEVARGRDEYRALATRFGCATLPSRANFVCIDVGSRERADTTLAALLERGVFVRKPAVAPLDGHVRVTVGTADERARFAAAFSASFAPVGA